MTPNAILRPDRYRLRDRRASGPPSRRRKPARKSRLIEKREVIGGVCINTGTIPSKTMREAVIHFSGFHYQAIYGMNYRVKEKVTHGRSFLPRPARDQDRDRRDPGPALAQQRRDADGPGELRRIRRTSTSRTRAARARIEAPSRDHRRGHQAGGVRPRSRSTDATSSTAIRSCRCRRCRER